MSPVSAECCKKCHLSVLLKHFGNLTTSITKLWKLVSQLFYYHKLCFLQTRLLLHPLFILYMFKLYKHYYGRRSSDSEIEATITFYGCFLFISFFLSSLATLSQTPENRHPRNFPTRRGLVFNRIFAIAISSKCTIKRTWAEKPEICTIFRAKSQIISAVVR